MLSKDTKQRLINEIYECRMNYINDSVSDIAMYGCDYKDLHKMSDNELIDEYEYEICIEDFEEGQVDELHQTAKAEMAVQQMLSGKPIK